MTLKQFKAELNKNLTQEELNVFWMRLTLDECRELRKMLLKSKRREITQERNKRFKQERYGNAKEVNGM